MGASSGSDEEPQECSAEEEQVADRQAGLIDGPPVIDIAPVPVDEKLARLGAKVGIGCRIAVSLSQGRQAM